MRPLPFFIFFTSFTLLAGAGFLQFQENKKVAEFTDFINARYFTSGSRQTIAYAQELPEAEYHIEPSAWIEYEAPMQAVDSLVNILFPSDDTQQILPLKTPEPEKPVELKLPDIAPSKPSSYVKKPTPVFPKTDVPLQFVIFAFDGSGSLSMWRQSIDFAEKMRTSGVKNFRYTYFINPVYLLDKHNKSVYMSPRGNIGSSNIGFGGSTQDILARIDLMNEAIESGHDFQSHAVGHWDGSHFTGTQWLHELQSFEKIVFGLGTLYSGHDLLLNPDDLIGFRAPELGKNNALYKTLHNLKFKYDTSGAQFSAVWPTKDSYGTWLFPLDVITYPATGKRILAMDYNFYYQQTESKNTLKKGTPEWDKVYNETYDAYKLYFDSHYLGNRAPVYIANHFGLWNDGVYWEVMKSVAQEFCAKPEVFCGSYFDLMVYMDEHPQMAGVR